MTDPRDFMLMDFALTLTRLAQFDPRYDEPEAARDARMALERWKDQERLWKSRGGEQR